MADTKTEKEAPASKEVATVKTGDVSTYAYSQDDGSGFENQTQADYKISWLTVLQSLSPQVKAPKDGGIEGARPGNLFITGDDQLHDPDETDLVLIPCCTEHVFVEWEPRAKGGGFVARYSINDPVVLEAKAKGKFGALKTVAENDLVETFYVYALTEHDQNPVIIGFNSTKIKVYQEWMTKLRKHQINVGGSRQTPPLFANRCLFSTIAQHNNKGDFYNFKITPAEDAVVDKKTGEVTASALAASLIPPGDLLLEAAIALKDMVQSGKAEVDYDAQDTATEAPSDEKAHF